MFASSLKTAKWRALPAPVVALAVLAFGAVAAQAETAPNGAFGPQLAASATPLAASFNRETYNYTSRLPAAQEARLYRVMVLEATDAKMVPSLRAANPYLKILVYQDGLLGRSTDPAGLTACSKYPAISAAQPSWFLKDQNGNRIQDKSYASNYLMDVGNPAYQQSCAAHAIALAKADGFDGIYMDDSTAWIGWAVPAGLTTPKYPTVASWQAAEYSFLKAVSAQVHAQGLLMVGNVGGSNITPGLWQKWGALLDGSEEQSFTDAGTGVAASLWTWKSQLADAAWSEANGKYALLHSFNTTETGNTFGLATMLLVGDGHDVYSTANANYNTYEMWYPEYTTAEQLGSPAGPYSRLANGAYERVFSGGVVLVNPTSKAIGSFSLGGGTYSGSGQSNVTSVSLPRASGLILARVG